MCRATLILHTSTYARAHGTHTETHIHPTLERLHTLIMYHMYAHRAAISLVCLFIQPSTLICPFLLLGVPFACPYTYVDVCRIFLILDRDHGD